MQNPPWILPWLLDLFGTHTLWLEKYAFHMEMGAGFIIVPAFVLLIVSVITVSHSTWKAARANPAESLKTEWQGLQIGLQHYITQRLHRLRRFVSFANIAFRGDLL